MGNEKAAKDIIGRLANQRMEASSAARAGRTREAILIVGVDTVAPDQDSAIARVKEYASPVNAIRLRMQKSCVETGLCTDCKSPQRLQVTL